MCRQRLVNVTDKETKEFFPPEVNIRKRISNRAEQLGLIVRPIADLNVMSSPLTMTRMDVDHVVSSPRRAIELTVKDPGQKGLAACWKSKGKKLCRQGASTVEEWF